MGALSFIEWFRSCLPVAAGCHIVGFRVGRQTVTFPRPHRKDQAGRLFFSGTAGCCDLPRSRMEDRMAQTYHCHFSASRGAGIGGRKSEIKIRSVILMKYSPVSLKREQY
ncbi:hypothetical protein ACQKGL_22385 [Ensifer adhaerens]|uniref:hypothetical protein n=1 Tax=Ensifer adhaerens TaxID=106592 RepID=UPI003D018FFE